LAADGQPESETIPNSIFQSQETKIANEDGTPEKEKINLRLDIGVSRYGVFPYVLFQESF